MQNGRAVGVLVLALAVAFCRLSGEKGVQALVFSVLAFVCCLGHFFF
jgi:hypothetical protein